MAWWVMAGLARLDSVAILFHHLLMLRIAIAALALASTAAQGADRFDLACSGTRQLSVREPAEQLTFGFRIDLSKKVWCWAHCERTFTIHDVLPDRIVLRSENESSQYRSYRSEAFLDRKSGRYESSSVELRPLPDQTKMSGQCEVRPFTGFPEAKF